MSTTKSVRKVLSAALIAAQVFAPVAAGAKENMPVRTPVRVERVARRAKRGRKTVNEAEHGQEHDAAGVIQFECTPLFGECSVPIPLFLARRNLKQVKAKWDQAAKDLGSVEAPMPDIPDDASQADIVRIVDRHFDKIIRYTSDSALHGESDFWANAEKTYGLRAGDCEDIVVAKINALLRLGFDKEDIQLVVVKERGGLQRAHAVAAVRVDGGEHVFMDNMSHRPLVTAQFLDRYKPSYSLEIPGSKGGGDVHVFGMTPDNIPPHIPMFRPTPPSPTAVAPSV